MGSEGSHLFKELGLAAVVGLFGDYAVSQQYGNPSYLHGEIEDDMVNIYFRDHCWPGGVLKFDQISKGFGGGSVRPCSGVGGERYSGGDAFSFCKN